MCFQHVTCERRNSETNFENTRESFIGIEGDDANRPRDNQVPTLTLRETFLRILSFLMSHSYIASLIIMMVGFVLYF